MRERGRTDGAIRDVPWDVSDVLYSEAKATAFKKWRDFEGAAVLPYSFSFDDAANHGTTLFVNLLRAKAEMDVAVVSIAGHKPRDYAEFLKSRLKDEYVLVLEPLRDILVYIAEGMAWYHNSGQFFFDTIGLAFNPSVADPTEEQRTQIQVDVGRKLHGFQKQLDELASEIADIEPSLDVVVAARKLLLLRKGDTYMGDVYQNIKDSTIINRSVVKTWNQVRTGINLAKLASELSRLRTAMRQEASTPEDDMSIGQIAAAETAASKRDGPGTIQHLKSAGQWALKVATKIGTTVAAEAITKALGLEKH